MRWLHETHGTIQVAARQAAGRYARACSWPAWTATSLPWARPASPSRTRASCAATAASRSCASTAGSRSPGGPPRAAGAHVRGPAPAVGHRRAWTPRRARCSSRPASRRRSSGWWSRAAGAASRSSSRCPSAPPTARVMTVTYAPTRVLNGLKTLSYGGTCSPAGSRAGAGSDEALLVTPHGRVLEGPTWTFFWAAEGRLRTPPLSEGILDSITRARLLDELRGGARRRARSTTCAPPRRRSSPPPCAR